MKIIKIVILLIVLTFQATFAQKFWLTTYEFPGKSKIDITISKDDCLFVVLTNGVLRSCNGGNKFDTVLISNPVYSIYSNPLGNMFVGGMGKIYISHNNGASWDSVQLNTKYPISKIITNKQGNLFAITGVLTKNGFEGDGVFYSEDDGLSWTQRNNGLGNYKCIEQIAIDKNNRLYIAAADEYVSGNSGLFISENSGLLWEHINIKVDGKNVINDEINIANTSCLSISNSDSVYFSFSGTAVNTSVRLNTVKYINQIRNDSFWKYYTVGNSSTWWEDKLLNNIFFAKNGDKYSSVSGSINFGGTFFTKYLSNNWQKINYGLGVDEYGKQNIQHFAETSNGKIFMVQLLDERVYYTDTSIVTSIYDRVNNQNSLFLYPNPVNIGGNILTKINNDLIGSTMKLIDVFGNIQYFNNLKEETSTFKSPDIPGVYFLIVENDNKKLVFKLIVY